MSWIPELPDEPGSFYHRLAAALDNAIARGDLRPGDQLPPQRDLAEQLGTTVGTVGRAYSLLRKDGKVTGEVGRGTYVIGGTGEAVNAGEARNGSSDPTRYRRAPAPRNGRSSAAGRDPVLVALEDIAAHLAAIRAMLETRDR